LLLQLRTEAGALLFFLIDGKKSVVVAFSRSRTAGMKKYAAKD